MINKPPPFQLGKHSAFFTTKFTDEICAMDDVVWWGLYEKRVTIFLRDGVDVGKFIHDSNWDLTKVAITNVINLPDELDEFHVDPKKIERSIGKTMCDVGKSLLKIPLVLMRRIMK